MRDVVFDHSMEKTLSVFGQVAQATGTAIWNDPVLFWGLVLIGLLTLFGCWSWVSQQRHWTARRRRYESEFADLPDTERMIKVSQAMDAAEKLGPWYPVK